MFLLMLLALLNVHFDIFKYHIHYLKYTEISSKFDLLMYLYGSKIKSKTSI